MRLTEQQIVQLNEFATNDRTHNDIEVLNSALYNAIINADELEVILAADHELTTQAANLLAHIVSNSNILSSINIRAPQNIIIEMIPHLSHAPSLQRVDLSNNNLGEHAVGVAEHLSHAPSLQTVVLRNNNLEEHAVGVAGHLSHVPSLQTVDLDSNNLEGYAFNVVERLSHAPSIQSISLNRTSLTAGETAAIIELINVHNQEVQNYNTDLVSLLKAEIKDHEGFPIPTEIATLMGDYLPDNLINVDII